MALHGLIRSLSHPARLPRIAASRWRRLRWDRYTRQVREPKVSRATGFARNYYVAEGIEEGVDEALLEAGITLDRRRVDVAVLEDYARRLGSMKRFRTHRNLYQHAWYKKSLEMYLTEARLAQDAAHQPGAYLDVGCEFSPAASYFREKYGSRVYELDLQNRPGVHGHKIGASAADIPLPDGSLRGIFLHCSLEHFEDDADVEFAREARRLLADGGWVLVTPVYLHVEDCAITDPASFAAGTVNFGEELVYCVPDFWNRFARLMAPSTMKSRILAPLGRGRATVIKIENYRQLSERLADWLHPYHLLFERDDHIGPAE